jgi:gephyrin
LATFNVYRIHAWEQPIVGVLSTGNEISDPVSEVQASKPLGSSNIFDSNRVMLKASLKQLGIEAVDFGIIKDDKDSVDRTLFRCLERVDILITTGGVSMGNTDFIKPFLDHHGQIKFGRLMMKPGKPTTFALIELNSKPRFVFALPGNPVSAIVTFHLFVSPALKGLCSNAYNLECCSPSRIAVKTRSSLKLDPERPEYHRAYCFWDIKGQCFVAQSTGNQISSRLLRYLFFFI